MKALIYIAVALSVMILIGYALIGDKNHNNKFYEYSLAEVVNDEMTITCRLLGTYHYNEKETVLTNPYELYIGVKSLKEVEIKSITLIDISTSDTLFEKDKPVISKKKTNNDTLIIYYSFKEISTRRSDVILKLEYGYDEFADSAELKLKATHKEHKSNKLWDILSGV